MLQFSIKNQTIKRTDNYRPVAGQPITCHFSFVTDNWQNLRKQAIFRISGSDTPYIRDLYITDSCDVPDELLLGTELRILTVSILGSGADNHVIVTTAPVYVLVHPSGSAEGSHNG